MTNGGFNYADNGTLIIEECIAPTNLTSVYQQYPVHIFLCERLVQPNYATEPGLQI